MGFSTGYLRKAASIDFTTYVGWISRIISWKVLAGPEVKGKLFWEGLMC